MSTPFLDLGPFELGLAYAVLLLVFLVTMGARWPWTRPFGVLLLALVTGGSLWIVGVLPIAPAPLAPGASGWSAALAADAPRLLPVALLLVLSLAVAWWTLHREQTRLEPPGPTGEGGILGRRARLVTVGLGLATVTAAAYFFPAGSPTIPGPDSAPGSAPGVPWFVSGLHLLRIAFGPGLAFVGIPLAMAAALWLAPHLETRNPETAAPFGGRRDEVPFFLFAWTFVGVLPIVLATVAGLPDPALSEARPLSERLWTDLLGLEIPGWLLVRELPGLVLILGLFVIAPWKLPEWKPTRGAFGRHRRRLGRHRYLLLMLIAGLTALVPAKLLAAWLLDVGPWIHLPEWGISL